MTEVDEFLQIAESVYYFWGEGGRLLSVGEKGRGREGGREGGKGGERGGREGERKGREEGG